VPRLALAGRDARARLRSGFLVGIAAVAIGGPVLGAAFPAALRIPRKESTRVNPLPTALFSHRTHGALVCFACHPSTFPQAPVAFTHDDMGQGQFCGHCHDGRTAFAVTGTPCGTCHVPAR
jgi:c(7)-type cytochrome triheme protein